MKYYMAETAEYVDTLQHFIDCYGDGDILLEMKRDIGGEMFCREEKEFVDNESCGNDCEYYDPCNGKSGRCRSLGNGFIETGKKYVLTDGKIPPKGECVTPETAIKKEIPGV